MGRADFKVQADFLRASGTPLSSLWPRSLASIAASTAAVYICGSREESFIGPLPGPNGEELYLISWGTCFAVHEEGYFVTAGHVVETGYPIYIASHSASQAPCGIFPAHTLKVVKEADLALLRAEFPQDLRVKPASLADESSFSFELMGVSLGYFGFFGAFLNVGEAPLDKPGIQPDELSLIYRTGILAGGGLVEIEQGIVKDTIWFQGISTPGTSGGPLFFPETGAVIGVVISQLRHLVPERGQDEAAGLSVAVPVQEVIQMLQKAAEEGDFPGKRSPSSATIRTR